MWLIVLSGHMSSWGSSIKAFNYATPYLYVINARQLLKNSFSLLTFYVCLFLNSCSNIWGMSNIGPSLGTVAEVDTLFPSTNSCRASMNTSFFLLDIKGCLLLLCRSHSHLSIWFYLIWSSHNTSSCHDDSIMFSQFDENILYIWISIQRRVLFSYISSLPLRNQLWTFFNNVI